MIGCFQKRRHVDDDDDARELGKNKNKHKTAERGDEPEMFGEIY